MKLLRFPWFIWFCTNETRFIAISNRNECHSNDYNKCWFAFCLCWYSRLHQFKSITKKLIIIVAWVCHTNLLANRSLSSHFVDYFYQLICLFSIWFIWQQALDEMSILKAAYSTGCILFNFQYFVGTKFEFTILRSTINSFEIICFILFNCHIKMLWNLTNFSVLAC